MPERIRTVNNLGGRWAADPWDSIESGNRAFAAEQDWRQRQMRQNTDNNNLMAQLAMARLASEDRRYDQTRSDNIGMFRDKLGFDERMYDKSTAREDNRDARAFDYQTGRDKIADDRYTNERNYNLGLNADGVADPSVNPERAAQIALLKLQTDEITARMQRDAAAAKRTEDANNNVPGMALTDPDELDLYNQTIAGGMSPAQGNFAVKTRRRERAKGAADVGASALGKEFQRFNRQDQSWFSADPGQGDEDRIAAMFEQTVKDYVAAGVPEAQAKLMAEQALTSKAEGDPDYETDYFADRTASLLKRLGLR